MANAKPVIYRISAPEPAFKGEVGGLYFANGVYEGEVPDGPLAYFTSQGYGVEEVKPTRTKPAQHSADDTAADAAPDAADDAANTTGSKS